MRVKVLQLYLTLPEIAAVLYAKEGSPQSATPFSRVRDLYRRHADEFRFGAPDGRAEHMDAGSIPASHRCRPCFLHDNMPGNGQTLVKLSSGAPWCMAPVG